MLFLQGSCENVQSQETLEFIIEAISVRILYCVWFADEDWVVTAYFRIIGVVYTAWAREHSQEILE